MTDAVLDANVIASGVLGLSSPTSAPGIVLRGWQQKRYRLVTSEHLIDEVRRTLNSPCFAERLDPDDAAATIAAFHEDAELIPVVIVVYGVVTHPDDDVVLATVVAAGTDYLETGDRPLLKLGSNRGVTILNPREFLAPLDAANAERREEGDVLRQLARLGEVGAFLAAGGALQ